MFLQQAMDGHRKLLVRALTPREPRAFPNIATCAPLVHEAGLRAAMPIGQYLNGQRFDFETLRIMGLAFEVARAALHIQGRRDAADKLRLA
jgi:hypothetical protein